MTLLIERSVIQWTEDFVRDKFERILWIDRSDNLVVLFPLTPEVTEGTFPIYVPLSEIEEAVEMGNAIIRTVDPYTRNFSSDSDFVKKHGKTRDEAWNKIKDLVLNEPDIYNPEKRGTLFKEAIAEKKISSRTLYKSCRKYWRYGKIPNALLPLMDKCGAPGKKREITIQMVQDALKKGKPLPKRGRKKINHDTSPGINLTTTDKENIIKAMKEFYLNQSENSFEEAHQNMLEKYYTKTEVDGTEVIDTPNTPSVGQTKSIFYSQRDLGKTISTRKGKIEFETNHRPKSGEGKKENILKGPGFIFQMDSTVCDVELVNSLDRSRKIGKATVYFIMDIFSRYIVGCHVGLEKGWDGAHRALFDAFTSAAVLSQNDSLESKKYCAVPKHLLFDKGPENIGLNSDNLALYFNIETVNTPSYRSDLKGEIEERFNWLKNQVRNIPGFTKHHIKPRGEKDPADKATFTVENLREAIKVIVDDYNNNKHLKYYMRDLDMVLEKVERCPAKLWKWGIENRGSLGYVDYETAIVNLLPRGKAVIRNSGIKFNKKVTVDKNGTEDEPYEEFFYSTPRAISEEWFVASGAKIGTTVDVAYDPYDVDVLYVVLDSGRVVERCNLTPKYNRFIGRHHAEAVDLIKAEKYETKEYEENAYQTKMKKNRKLSAIKNDANAKTAEDINKSGWSLTRQKSGKRAAALEEKFHDQGNTSITQHLKRDVVKEVDIAEVEEDELTLPRLPKYQQLLNQLKERRRD